MIEKKVKTRRKRPKHKEEKGVEGYIRRRKKKYKGK